jgi:hypothetical protein
MFAPVYITGYVGVPTMGSKGDGPAPFGNGDVEPSDSRGYDPVTDSFHARHDLEGTKPFYQTVIEAIAAVTGDRVTEMEPLSAAVDLEALETVLNTGREAALTATFTYGECRIRVAADGRIAVSLDG